MTANVDNPPSPLTPSRLGTPPTSMADPVESLAWDDMSAALEMDIFGNLSTDNGDNDPFAPINFPPFPAPDLEKTKANTCEAREQSTARVESVLRGYPGKRNLDNGSFRRNKKHFQKVPHIVDGHVDQFPRLKNITRLQENNEFNRAPYRRTPPSRRFNNYPTDSDAFRPRRRNYYQAMPVSQGFHDMPASAPYGYWNPPALSGAPFGSRVPQVPRYPANNTEMLKMGNVGMNLWMPTGNPNYNQLMSGQFNGFPQGFGNIPYSWPQMLHQSMVPQGTQPLPKQAPMKPLFPRASSSPGNPCTQQGEVAAQQDMPSKVIEIPSQTDGISEAVSAFGGDGKGAFEKRVKENAKQDGAALAGPTDVRKMISKSPEVVGKVSSGKKNAKPIELAAKGASGSRPVPDVEMLRRTLENIKKGNALRRKNKQSRKTRTSHPEARPKQHQRPGYQKPPFGQPNQETAFEDQEIKRNPRLVPRGGIQKQPFPRQNRGLPPCENKYNKKWRPSRYSEDDGNRSPFWMQSGSGHGNTGWRGNNNRNVRRGGFRRNNYRHAGGQISEYRNDGPGGFGNRKSVLSRLGWNRTQSGMPPNFANMDYTQF